MPGEWLNYLTRRENIVTRYYRDSIFHTMDRHRRLNKYQDNMIHLQLLSAAPSLTSITAPGISMIRWNNGYPMSSEPHSQHGKLSFGDRARSLQISSDHQAHTCMK